MLMIIMIYDYNNITILHNHMFTKIKISSKQNTE